MRQVSEAKIRKELIDPQIEKAGWDVRDSAQVGTGILLAEQERFTVKVARCPQVGASERLPILHSFAGRAQQREAPPYRIYRKRGRRRGTPAKYAVPFRTLVGTRAQVTESEMSFQSLLAQSRWAEHVEAFSEGLSHSIGGGD